MTLTYIEIKDKQIKVDEKITYETFIEVRNKMHLKNYTLMRMLGISKYSFNKLENNEISKVRIKNIKIQHIVDLIKIDLKYSQNCNGRYYLVSELKEICKKRKIGLDDFVRYYDKNYKYYKFNKIIIKKSEKGFWIGNKMKMPNEFIDKYGMELERRINKIGYKVCNLLNCHSHREDLIGDARLELLENWGYISKKFYFDTNLILNILASKCKFSMMNIYRKKYYKEKLNIHYDKFTDIEMERISFLKDETYT